MLVLLSRALDYDKRCIDDFRAMLKTAGDCRELCAAAEQKPIAAIRPPAALTSAARPHTIVTEIDYP